jgi:hypothetical protein
MTSFISLYPELVFLFIGCLFSVVGGLLAVVGYLLKEAIDRLNKTIQTLTTNHENLESKVTDMDVELTRHITMCNVCRRSCPEFAELEERRRKERRTHNSVDN